MTRAERVDEASDLPKGYRMTELGPLPEEWRVSRLEGLVVRNDSGAWGEESVDGDCVEVLRSTNMQGGRWVFEDVAVRKLTARDRQRCTLVVGDVLVTKSSGSRDHIGKCAYVDPDVGRREACFSNFMQRLRFGPDFVPVFAYYFMLVDGRRQLLEASTTTTGLRNLKKGDFDSVTVPVPPLPEQEAIASVLSAVQEARQKTEAVIAAARALKQSLMKYLFTYGPVPVGEAENVKLKETEIGEVPEEWDVVEMRELAVALQYGTSKRCNTDGGMPVLRIPNVVHGVVDTSELKYLPASDPEALKLKLAEGDVLFVRTNANRTHVGRCVVYGGEPPSASFASYLIRAKVDRSRIAPGFFGAYVWSDGGRAFFYQHAGGAADGKFNINTQTIRALPVPVPLPATQQQIVEALNAADEKLAAEEARKEALDELFRTLLNDLMTAKLRVNDLEVAV